MYLFEDQRKTSPFRFLFTMSCTRNGVNVGKIPIIFMINIYSKKNFYVAYSLCLHNILIFVPNRCMSRITNYE